MRICNRCDYHQAQRAAQHRGLVLSLVREDGWWRVYRHPPRTEITRLSAPQRTRYRTGISYLEMPEQCCC